MDDLSFRLGNLLLGNPEGAPGLEATLDGPRLQFSHEAAVTVTGAAARVTIDDVEVPMWERVIIPAGGVLDVGAFPGPGLRSYILFAGGLDVPAYLGSASTFLLGGFGGPTGRKVAEGEVLRPGDSSRIGSLQRRERVLEPPMIEDEWEISVLEGPHGAPEFFTEEDLEVFYSHQWVVHFNSARTGVRLSGPKPTWTRPDGGDAGLHPSNIHDTPYAVATVDYTGDTPILLGPDGPSLGGFVCPATVISADRWKLGQLRPGDLVRFVPVSPAAAKSARTETRRALADLRGPSRSRPEPTRDPGQVGGVGAGVIWRRSGEPDRPEVTYRRAGDENLLIEYGPMALSLGIRMRVQVLADAFESQRSPGVIDLTAGIRSLQVHVDPDVMGVEEALDLALQIESELPGDGDLEVPSRTVHLPLSWDDPSTREAIERYMAGVRPDAPWCPWNIEFIRRVNGLGSTDEVREIVHNAEYLVLGLGDVYLGAPVATPVDPRHRLVTTKYNPARTWTPENAVGIGGAYLCIYGMEGPGGYQFIGRTVPVWSRWQQRGPFEPGVPWLLRPFDRIRWYPVGADELLELRAAANAGQLDVDIEYGRFNLADHQRFLEDNASSIEEFRLSQTTAFNAERARWELSGEFERKPETEQSQSHQGEVGVPDGGHLVVAPLAASIWRVDVSPGDVVGVDTVICLLEAMKLETAVRSPAAGTVREVFVRPGQQVSAGAPLAVLSP
jgi:urea carboxylase